MFDRAQVASLARRFRWSKCWKGKARRWKIEGIAHGSSWSSDAFELFKLLHNAGMRIIEASPDYLQWSTSVCDEIFRATFDGELWIVESKEWGGARWIECDERMVNLALGDLWANPTLF